RHLQARPAVETTTLPSGPVLLRPWMFQGASTKPEHAGDPGALMSREAGVTRAPHSETNE
ncbi:MAG: hypothetical protein ACREX8_09680, partial [Gammaproteobacteria bacterium]